MIRALEEGGEGYAAWKCHFVRWSGVVEHAGAADRLLDEFSRAGRRFDYDHKHGDPKWSGRADLKSLREAHRAVAEPWEFGMDAARRLTEEFRRRRLKAPVVVRRRQVWDVSGDHYDLDRHRAGAEPWRADARRVREGPRLVTLLVNLTGAWYLTAEELMMTGLAAVTLANVLEAAGFSCRLVGFSYLEGLFQETYDERWLQTWDVKPAGRPVPLYALVNAVSPWFFRKVAWSAHYMVPGRRPTPGQGYCAPLTTWAYGLLARDAGSNAVYLLEGLHDVARACAKIDEVIENVNAICK